MSLLRVTLRTVLHNSEVYDFTKAIVKSKTFTTLVIGVVDPQGIDQLSAQSLVLSNFVSTCFFEIVPTLLLWKVVKTVASYDVFSNGLNLCFHDIIHNGWVGYKNENI